MIEKLWRLWRRIAHFRSDSDIEDELRVHLELSAEDHLASGVTSHEAQRRARLQLGRSRSIIESLRDQDFMTALEGWYRDLLLGVRALASTPIFCLTSVLTLALGIGANTAVFSVLYGLLLRSLPVTHAAELARVGIVSSAFRRPEDTATFVTYRMFQQLSKEQHSFTELSAWDSGSVTMEDKDGNLRWYDAGLVSGNGFATLGLTAYRGRLIVPADDVAGQPPNGWPVVLSYGIWKSRFGGDPQIIGKQIVARHTPLTVVGIAPAGFQGIWPGIDAKLYLPFQFLNVLVGHDVLNTQSSLVGCSAIGRLRPGVSLRQADAELAVRRQELLNSIPLESRHLSYFENASFRVESARAGLPTFFESTYSQPLFLLQGLVGAVLILCCVNVGGLMMSRVYARQREFAVRTAIGAARWRLVRQHLTESLVIAMTGALLGAIAAWYGAGFLLHFFRHPNMFEGMSVHTDATVFLVTGLLAVATTLFFGTVPAWRAGQADTGILLRSRKALGGPRHVAGRAFVPIQVALSVALFALAILLSQSLAHLRSEHTGFDMDHVTIQTPPFDELPQKGGARLDLYQRMVDRMEQFSGVESAAVTWYTPLTGDQATASFEVVNHNPHSAGHSQLAYNEVGPGYFRTMHIGILSGREFAKNERQRTLCMLNQSAAAFLFPNETALGQSVRSSDTKAFQRAVACRVIGIAEDAKFAKLSEPAPRTIYFPINENTVQGAGNLVFLINSGTKAEAIAAYRTALKEIAPSIPLVLFVTLREQMDAALGSQRLITVMSNFFAALAVFLSAVGLYGLLSSSVVQRTGEIGVRMALGAQRMRVLRMILREALGMAGVGLLLGLVILFVAVRFVEGMLYRISAFDPFTLLATFAVLLAVTLFAGLWPALNAASVDPMEALRAE